MPSALSSRYHRQPQPLGRWILTQADRAGAIGDLAKAARTDRGFPKDGDYEAISRRLNELQVDGEMHAALEQADIEAACY